MLEPLITQVANRFTLGHDETRQLYRLLVVRLNREPGGLSAFLDRAADLRMASMVESWLGNRPDEPIAPGQVDELLGADAIEDMAERLGLTSSAVSGVLSDLLPAAVRALARGTVPAAAVSPVVVRHGDAMAAQEAAPSHGSRWALVAVAAVALGAWWYFSRRQAARAAAEADWRQRYPPA